MRKTFSIAIFLCCAAGIGHSQGAKAPAHPDSVREKSLPAPADSSVKDPQLDRENPDDEFFTISKQVDEVNLFFSVTDSKGRVVDNLTADDLKLMDNNKSPLKWNYFQARTNLPLSVILAIDVSSSVRDRLRFEQQAASVFFKQIMRKETDEAAIIAFGSGVQEKSQGMTSDVNILDHTIRTLQAGGETAMYDAIVLASHKLRARRRGVVRPVIILITDGDDTASKASLHAAEEAAIRSEAAIFALDANSIYDEHPKGRLILDKLTHETGGFVLSARENSDLKGSFRTIEKVLRSQYALGYPPPDLEANGAFRFDQCDLQ